MAALYCATIASTSYGVVRLVTVHWSGVVAISKLRVNPKGSFWRAAYCRIAGASPLICLARVIESCDAGVDENPPRFQDAASSRRTRPLCTDPVY